MSEHRRTTPVVFLDFDGTITRRDVTDVILESYADESWLEVERRWRAGRIGSRECLRAQMSLVRATRAQLEALVDTIEVDEGFAGLLEACARRRAHVFVISDGFDHFIRRILERPRLGLARLLRGVRVCASHLEFDSRGEMRLDFPYFRETCEHGCATCKPAVLELLNAERAPSVFVGDGLSDRYAAACADLVFAKNSLAQYCREQEIEHVAYERLREVASRLDSILDSTVPVGSLAALPATA
ncbi:MAG TPA: MtnX-like HAD-IB family phosphatase [Pyrinomonadaceae bacterium]|nr:MtnX-like HAD-IB family phosphatase [Pyrinomonadaceae bacterium]